MEQIRCPCQYNKILAEVDKKKIVVKCRSCKRKTDIEPAVQELRSVPADEPTD